MKTSLLLFLFAMLTLNLIGQEKLIHGNITDENDEPLVGATILIKHTSTGKVTELDGTFELEKSKTGDTLVISYLGFTPQEIIVTDHDEYRVRLKESASELPEVVIVANKKRRGCIPNWCSSVMTTQYYFTNSLSEYSSSLTSYPNPSKGSVTLKSENPLETIYIANSNGQILKTWTSIQENQKQLDLSSYPAGTYFIIQGNEKEQTGFTKVVLVK